LKRDDSSSVDGVVLFNQIDLNKDGKISADEYLWFVGIMTGSRSNDMTSFMDHFNKFAQLI
jgi:EF hand